MSRIVATLARMDWLLLLAALLLSLIGLAAIGSVGLAHDPPSATAVTKQAIALGLGLALGLALALANYRALEHYARPLYLGALALLVAVLLFGRTVNGTRGWFSVGGWGFQPVEFAKVALVVLLARFMSKHAHMRDRRSLVSSAVVAGALTGLVLLQPDFGGGMILVGIWGTLMLLAGVRRVHLAGIAGIALVVALSGWFLVLKDYQRERFLTFLDPSRAPLTRGYNIAQAKIAIGAGGLLGKGLGFGSQSQLRFVPEAQTDFVFAVIGEELGFAGVTVVFGLFLLFFARAMRLARRSRDNFTLFLIIGLLAEVMLSLSVNAGMNLGLLPVTGIALPFLSAGGSSLLATWVAVGILESVAVRGALGGGDALTEGLVVGTMDS